MSNPSAAPTEATPSADSLMWEGIEWDLVRAQSSGPRVELEMPTAEARDALQATLKGLGIVGLAKGDREVTAMGGSETRVYHLVVNADALKYEFTRKWQPDGGTARILAA